jgi:sugar lactone lactonase YvrE
MSRDLAARTLASGFSFLECPRWRAGRLYVSDFYTGRVLAFDIDGRHERICEVSGQPSGLGFLPDGSLLVVSMIDRCVLRWRAGRLERYADVSSLAPFHANDMLVDEEGGAYVGNFGWDLTQAPTIRATTLARIDPRGTVTAAAEDVVFPNGMVLADGGRTLLIAETFAARITAFDRDSAGLLSNRRVWASLAPDAFTTVSAAIDSGAALPDGMAIDAEGAVWIGDAGGRAALRVAQGGAILDRVAIGDLTPYAVALGGPDGRTLFMCASPPLFTADPSVEHRSTLMSCTVAVPAAIAGARR